MGFKYKEEQMRKMIKTSEIDAEVFFADEKENYTRDELTQGIA